MSLKSWIIESLVHVAFKLTDVSLDWNLLPSAGEAAVQVCDVRKATTSLRWRRHLRISRFGVLIGADVRGLRAQTADF